MIETERLILRQPIRADFEDFAEMFADADVRKYTGGVYSKPKAWASFCAWCGEWALQGYSFFSVIEKSNGKWVGRCGAINRDDFGLPELGWSFMKPAQGKGYAREAANAALDWGMKDLGWQENFLFINAENEPSLKMARDLGYSQIPNFNHPFEFHSKRLEIYRIGLNEWEILRGFEL